MSRLLRPAAAIAAKDLRLFFRDRVGLLLAFLMPAALVLAFGFMMQKAFGGEDGGMARAELWVVDQDGSAASRAFVDDLRGLAMLEVRPAPDDAPLSLEGAEASLRKGRAHHVLVLPRGFGDALAAGELPELRMLRDPGRSLEDTLVTIGLSSAYMGATQGRAWPAMLGRLLEQSGASPEAVRSAVAAAEQTRRLMEAALGRNDGKDAETGRAPEGDGGDDGQDGGSGLDFTAFMRDMVPLEVEDRLPPERAANLSHIVAQSVSGLVVMMLMFGLVRCATTLLRERDSGTLDRLLAAASPRDAVLLGKFLFTAASGLLQLAVLFTFAELVFHVGMFRDPVTLLVLSLSLTAAVTAFGMLIATWARSLEQANGFATLLILVMSAVGGAWFPVQLFDMPLPAEVAMRLTLTHWAMTGYQGMLWNGLGWTSPTLLTSIGVLWAFAVGASLLARRLFHRRVLPA